MKLEPVFVYTTLEILFSFFSAQETRNDINAWVRKRFVGYFLKACAFSCVAVKQRTFRRPEIVTVTTEIDKTCH